MIQLSAITGECHTAAGGTDARRDGRRPRATSEAGMTDDAIANELRPARRGRRRT